jgi:hypothetical protein
MDYSHFDSIDFDSLLDDLSSDYTSSEDYESSSVSSDSVSTFNKNTFKKSYYTPEDNYPSSKKKLDFIPRVVRIVRSDIRRSYPTMLANVWNSLDFHMIYGFMDTYFQRDFEQRSNKVHPNTNTSYSKSIFGVETVAKLVYTNAILQPDSVFTLKETNVYKSTDKSQNRVVSTFNLLATRIFDIPDMEKLFQLATTHSTPEEIENRVGTKRKSDYTRQFVMDDIIRSVHDITDELKLLEVPEKVEYGGSFTLYTDEEDRVSSMVMEMRAVNLDPSPCPVMSKC